MFSLIPLIVRAAIGWFSSKPVAVASTVAAVAAPVTSPVKVLLKLAIVLLVAGGVAFAWWDIDHLKSELAVAQANYQAVVVTNGTQKQALAECTANTEALKKASDDWAAKAAAAQEAATKAAAPSYEKAKKILAKKPAAGQSDAEAANELLDSLIPASKS